MISVRLNSHQFIFLENFIYIFEKKNKHVYATLYTGSKEVNDIKYYSKIPKIYIFFIIWNI